MGSYVSGPCKPPRLSLNELNEFVSDKTFTTLPPDPFHGLQNLSRLLLTVVSDYELPDTVFSGAPALSDIYLGGKLTKLPPGLFKNLDSPLKRLTLALELDELPAGFFSELKSLKDLSLKGQQCRENMSISRNYSAKLITST